jgi:hypothetical protein
LNGAQIPNETQSYIYIKNGGILAMGQEYRALLTRVSDGVKIFTCPLIPTPHTDITLYPTIVGASSQFHIISKSAQKVRLYTVTGILLSTHQLQTDELTPISAPSVAGVYILVFEDANGGIESRKIIVK